MILNPYSKRKLLSAVLAGAMMLCTLTGCGAAQQPPADEEPSGPKLTYASEGVTIVDDQDALQAAYNEAKRKAQEGMMSLEYKNTAVSNDGVNFGIYLANSASNSYDMYIGIYSDIEFTDQLFLSGLLRPGTKFETIKLDRALEPGVHTVYVVHTQVEEDLQTLHAQVTITMQFVVTESDTTD